MDISGIAATASDLSASKLQQQIGIAVMGKAMDAAKQQSDGFVAMLQAAPHPYLGGKLDLRA